MTPSEASLPTLQELGGRYPTDKFAIHHYDDVYEAFFGPLRSDPVTLLEIGVGDEDYALGGGSLQLWAEYFPTARIVGIDLYDKSALDDDRITTRVCDQSSIPDLQRLSADLGPFDIVIDDGSHHGRDVNLSLFGLFPLLQPGGLYVIEDLQTSYWPHYGGSSLAPWAHDTAVRWVKLAVDIVNRPEVLSPGVFALLPALDIAEVHVFHNIAVLKKSDGVPTSSVVLTPEVRAEYLAEDVKINGRRAAAHDELVARPDQFGHLLDLISDRGGLDALLAAGAGRQSVPDQDD